MTHAQAVKLKTKIKKLDRDLDALWERLVEECPHEKIKRNRGLFLDTAWDEDRCVVCDHLVRNRLERP